MKNEKDDHGPLVYTIVDSETCMDFLYLSQVVIALLDRGIQALQEVHSYVISR